MAPVRVAPSKTFSDLGIEVGSKKAVQREIDIDKYTPLDLITISFTWDPKFLTSGCHGLHCFSSDISIKTDK
jgi:hypothetical protein